jgi:hypothetical protein
MKHFVLSILILFTVQAVGQVNLVVNPSFETYSTCPQDPSVIWYATSWFQPSNGTPDYYNSCFDSLQPWSSIMDVPQNAVGYQNAKTGVAYAGLFASYPFYTFSPFREYIEIKLSNPLMLGQKYFVSFWLSLSDSSNYAADDIGLCFSNDSILNDTTFILYASPQIENISGSFITDKTGWTILTSEYIAVGGEEFIAIGNFKDNTNTDTLHVTGGGDASAGSQNNAAYYYIDDVCISTDSLLCAVGTGIKENYQLQLQAYPNPVMGVLTVNVFRNSGIIKIYSCTGELMYQQFYDNGGKHNIDMIGFSNGIYLLQFETKTETYNQKILLTQ